MCAPDRSRRCQCARRDSIKLRAHYPNTADSLQHLDSEVFLIIIMIINIIIIINSKPHPVIIFIVGIFIVVLLIVIMLVIFLGRVSII